MAKPKFSASRKSNLSTVGESFNQLLKTYQIQKKFDATRLTSSWERLMGSPIAKRTKRVFVKDRKLFVELSSAPLKHELSLSKRMVLDIFEREFGQNLLDDIVFI
jgi:predicted nucleic acid-binding Zn ribbon protein